MPTVGRTLSTLTRTTWIREHHAGGHVDRLRPLRSVEDELDLERWGRAVTSEASAASTDDGTRVESGTAAGAVEGHGWSVSAKDVRGNLADGEWREGDLAVFQHDGAYYRAKIDAVAGCDVMFHWLDDAPLWLPMSRLQRRWPDSSSLVPEKFQWLDAVRDEPVLPDPEPEANSAVTSVNVWNEDRVATTRDNCPSCCKPRRERGEVRTSIWRCGCAVRPESVYNDWWDAYGDRRLNEPSDSRGWERLWFAAGHGAAGQSHPTEAGAIAAWRTALAELQRREDAQ